MTTSGLARAIVVLFWSLLRVLWRRAMGELGGVRLFRQNYLPDHLPEHDAADREALAGFGGCIACGRCDDERGEGTSSVMLFVLAGGRQTPDLDATERLLEGIPERALAEREARGVCPTGVPFVSLARFVRRKAAQTRELEEQVARGRPSG